MSRTFRRREGEILCDLRYNVGFGKFDGASWLSFSMAFGVRARQRIEIVIRACIGVLLCMGGSLVWARLGAVFSLYCILRVIVAAQAS
jgi:hypothetical protein